MTFHKWFNSPIVSCASYKKKRFFCVYSRMNFIMFVMVVFIIFYLFFQVWKIKQLLDDTCYRTMYLHLKSNCVIEHYPISSNVIYNKLCHLCRFKIVTKPIKNKLHFLDKKFIVSKNASYIWWIENFLLFVFLQWTYYLDKWKSNIYEVLSTR